MPNVYAKTKNAKLEYKNLNITQSAIPSAGYVNISLNLEDNLKVKRHLWIKEQVDYLSQRQLPDGAILFKENEI